MKMIKTLFLSFGTGFLAGKDNLRLTEHSNPLVDWTELPDFTVINDQLSLTKQNWDQRPTCTKAHA